jgi:hypothetical protein
VEQRGRLERMVAIFARHQVPGQPVEIGSEQVEKPVGRRVIDGLTLTSCRLGSSRHVCGHELVSENFFLGGHANYAFTL